MTTYKIIKSFQKQKIKYYNYFNTASISMREKNGINSLYISAAKTIQPLGCNTHLI